MLRAKMALLLCLALLNTASAEMTGFIVGGNEASISDWPFIGFVSISEDNEPVGACGASLISSQTMLTAAHCLDDVTEKKKKFNNVYTYSILMGHKEFIKSTMQRTVQDYHTHEKYDTGSVPHDIGVMFLERPVEFQDTVKKVLLMTQNLARNMGKEGGLKVGGWGKFSPDLDDISSVLKSLEQVLISPRQCRKYFKEDDIHKMDPGVLCAGKVNSLQYAYSGDSGGPLARIRDQYLAGVVSYRMESHGITIYTSVPYYYNWIENTQKKLFEQHCKGKMGVIDLTTL